MKEKEENESINQSCTFRPLVNNKNHRTQEMLIQELYAWKQKMERNLKRNKEFYRTEEDSKSTEKPQINENSRKIALTVFFIQKSTTPVIDRLTTSVSKKSYNANISVNSLINSKSQTFIDTITQSKVKDSSFKDQSNNESTLSETNNPQTSKLSSDFSICFKQSDKLASLQTKNITYNELLKLMSNHSSFCERQ